MKADLLLAVRVLMLGAAVLALLLERRQRSHRPVAVFLGSQAAIMLARWALRVHVVGPAVAAGGNLDAGIAGAPLTGWALAAGISYNAGSLAWPAGLAALSLWIYADMPLDTTIIAPKQELVAAWKTHRRNGSRRILWVLLCALAWAGAVAFVALTYPAGRPLYPKLFAGAEVAALVVGLGSAGAWVMRACGREGLGVARACTLFMLGCGVVSLAGPYVYGIFSAWWLANAVQLVMYSGLILAQGGAVLWLYRSR